MTFLFTLLRSDDSAARPAADFPGLLGSSTSSTPGWASPSRNHIYYLAAIPLFAWPTAFVLVLVTVAFIVVVRWIVVLPRVREGTYSVWSWFYLRKWAVVARDRGDAGDAVVAVRDALHAQLVSH